MVITRSGLSAVIKPDNDVTLDTVLTRTHRERGDERWLILDSLKDNEVESH